MKGKIEQIGWIFKSELIILLVWKEFVSNGIYSLIWFILILIKMEHVKAGIWVWKRELVKGGSLFSPSKTLVVEIVQMLYVCTDEYNCNRRRWFYGSEVWSVVVKGERLTMLETIVFWKRRLCWRKKERRTTWWGGGVGFVCCRRRKGEGAERVEEVVMWWLLWIV